MYAKIRLRDLPFGALVMVTFLFLFLTVLVTRDWLVATHGISTTGHVIAASHCVDKYGHPFNTVQYLIKYVDESGADHTAQSNCLVESYSMGQEVSFRYLNMFPGYILTHDEQQRSSQPPPMIILLFDAVLLTASVLWSRVKVTAWLREFATDRQAFLARRAARLSRRPPVHKGEHGPHGAPEKRLALPRGKQRRSGRRRG